MDFESEGHRVASLKKSAFYIFFSMSICNALGLLLSNTIIKNPVSNSVFHSEFDNFDKLHNNITGKESIHTAHDIMLQELDHLNTEELNMA